MQRSLETMTAEAFVAWSERQTDRHELLDGIIVKMASERATHARVKYAVTRAFDRAIEEGRLPCEAFVDGMAVRVDEATVFEPDALVRCGPPLPGETVLILDPVIVVEVAWPSTQRVDAVTKLTRYFCNASIMHYLIVLPGPRSVCHHRRGADERIETTILTSGSLQLDPPGMRLEVDALFPE